MDTKVFSKDRLVGFACIAIVAIVLTLGLWPFHAPANEVAWLKDQNGLQFGDYGTVMSVGSFNITGEAPETSCSVELWLGPPRRGEYQSGTILAFYVPRIGVRLSLQQSLSDLLLQTGDPHGTTAERLYVDNVFHDTNPVFVTVASGPQGTSVYINGSVTKTVGNFRINASDCKGRLILGSSPRTSNAFPGQVRAMAIYHSDLSPATVLQHYDAWIQSGRPEVNQNERDVGLYRFDERAGNIVHSQTLPAVNLQIPAAYTVLDQISLQPFWEEYYPEWGYWENDLKNVVGFVPLGFCFYSFFSRVRHHRRSGLLTVLVGFAVSFTIEVAQAYLPTRMSGTTDLITNTLGAYGGVLVYRGLWSVLAR